MQREDSDLHSSQATVIGPDMIDPTIGGHLPLLAFSILILLFTSFESSFVSLAQL